MLSCGFSLITENEHKDQTWYVIINKADLFFIHAEHTEQGTADLFSVTLQLPMFLLLFFSSYNSCYRVNILYTLVYVFGLDFC